MHCEANDVGRQASAIQGLPCRIDQHSNDRHALTIGLLAHALLRIHHDRRDGSLSQRFPIHQHSTI